MIDLNMSAVYEQKKELREYKKKAKAQES